MSKTTIEWTGETWNPTVGCVQVSPGCANCYAKTLHDKRQKAFTAGKLLPLQYAKPFEALQLLPDRLDAPLRRKKPTKYFVNSVSDLFHEDVPFEFINRVFATMALAGRHTFQVLTKRAERMRSYFAEPGLRKAAILKHALKIAGDVDGRPEGGLLQEAFLLEELWDKSRYWPLPNVWLGVSVENQRFADDRIPLLLQTPAAVRFISAEPLLGPVSLAKVDGGPNEPDWHPLIGWKTTYQSKPRTPNEGAIGVHSSSHDSVGRPHPKLDWVIIGGESGAGARPFRVQWARAIIQQCQVARVACFMKQLGANLVDDDFPAPRIDPVTGARTLSVRQTLTIRDRKGGDMGEWPEDLRVREFPEARS